MKTTYLILPISLFIVSCSSSPPKRAEPVEHFVTHITFDGTKKFSFSVVSSKPREDRGRNKGGGSGNRGGGGRGGRGGRGGGQGKNQEGSRDRNEQSQQKPMMKEKFLQRLERILFEKDYCHEGYSKLEAIYDRKMSQYRGRCAEKANEDDLLNFPNQ